jgi:glutamine amidotransferase
VLLSSSEESPGVKGLDIFKGHVAKIPEGRKIPHMGWNQIKQTKDCPILEGVDGKDFYFVHSYHAVLDDESNLSAVVDYGIDLTASVSKDNVFATQFHPEKSGVPGLKILKNFVSLE